VTKALDLSSSATVASHIVSKFESPIIVAREFQARAVVVGLGRSILTSAGHLTKEHYFHIQQHQQQCACVHTERVVLVRLPESRHEVRQVSFPSSTAKFFSLQTSNRFYREIEDDLVPEWRAKYFDYKVRIPSHCLTGSCTRIFGNASY